MTSPSRAPAPGRRLPDTRVPVFVRASTPARAQAPATAQRSHQPAARPGTTTKAESDAILRRELARIADEPGLDAQGVMALVQAGATRRLAAQTRAENVRAATTTYDAVFGPGAFVADARS